MRERHLLVVDAAVPVLVAAVILVGQTLHGGASTPAHLTLGLSAAAVLAGRRRWPGWTLLVSGVLVGALFHLDPSAASVAVLAPAVGMYSMALRRGRAQQVTAGLGAIVAVLVADLIHPSWPSLTQTIGHVLLVAVPLLAAEVIRTHQANLQLLTERLELAEQAHRQDVEHRAEQERMRMARDLHDVVAHTLTEVNVIAAAAAEQSAPGQARDALERIERRSHDAIGELRGIVGVLRGPDSGDAPRRPTPGLDDVPELIDRIRSTGLGVAFESQGSPPSKPSEATSVTAYRIVQESLTNVCRHAPGAGVTVGIRYDAGCLALTIINDVTIVNGQPDPAVVGDRARVGSGVGIVGMRERARTVGGHLFAGPHDGGFRVHTELPYEPSR